MDIMLGKLLGEQRMQKTQVFSKSEKVPYLPPFSKENKMLPKAENAPLQS